jgi:predicted TIM-barrel fold metal-dependent hydrolase
VDLVFVDADGHLLEPPNALQEFAPAQWVDRVWHIETDDGGTEWAVWNDRRVPANAYAVAGTAGFSEGDKLRARRGEFRYTEVRPSAFDANGYADELASDGIARSVVYPSMLLNLACLPDSEFAVVQARCYNDFVSEFAVESRGRVFAAALLPQQDITAAAKEIDRVADLPGIVAVMMRPNPTADWKPFNHEIYDPIWRAAADTGLPVALHPTASTGIPNVAEAMRINRVGGSTAPVRRESLFTHDIDNAFFVSCAAQFDVMIALMFITAGGVCERFPAARFAFLEANGGWLVPWLERMDHKAQAYPWDLPQLRHEPSEYFRRQCWISFDPDERLLAATASSDVCGADRLVWASDFPHQDADFPGVTTELREAIAVLDVHAQRAVASANASALYHLPA